MEQEIWRVIECWGNGIFFVSNFGNIKSIRNGKSRILHPRMHGGYKNITLNYNGKLKTFAVHRLVALSFLPNIDGKNDIDHIDGSRTNNIYTNLRWCNKKENANNPITRQRIISLHKNEIYRKHQQNAKIASGKTKEIHKYSLNNEYIDSYKSTMDAAKSVNLKTSTKTSTIRARISHVLDSKNNIAYGFRWKTKKIEPTQ